MFLFIKQNLLTLAGTRHFAILHSTRGVDATPSRLAQKLFFGKNNYFSLGYILTLMTLFRHILVCMYE